MKIKAISFNIRFCDDPNGHSIAERAPRLGCVISKYSPDIIGLQEYNPNWEPYIAAHFGSEYGMFLKYRNNTVDIEASPILWRKNKFDCVKTGYFWLSDTPEVESRGWDELCSCYRMCVYTILKEKSTGMRFTVMNTHFGFGDRGQLASVELIYRYSKQISSFPTFILGDFNMTPASPAYAAMTGKFTDVNARTANDLSITFHNYAPHILSDQHIDYCFADSTVTPIKQKILKESFDGKYTSDHFGLYLELDI